VLAETRHKGFGQDGVHFKLAEEAGNNEDFVKVFLSS